MSMNPLNLAREQAEILRAAIVLAVTDGVITSSEKGLLEALARRLGVSTQTLRQMTERALVDSAVHDELFRVATADPEFTLELLVAAARIDGEIHERERAALLQMSQKLAVPVGQFEHILTRGVARADAVRAQRKSN